MSWRSLTPLGWAAIAALVLMLGALSWCAITGPGREREKLTTAAATASVRTMQTDAGAKAAAADERLADQVVIANLKEELTDAVKDLPADAPSVRRRALACARLRHQGDDTSALPGCIGLEGPGQAAP